MRDARLYSTLKGSWTKIVGREEIASMLSAQDLASAVKAIASKPIGASLYEVASRGACSFYELDRRLLSFNSERVERTFRDLEERDRAPVDFLSSLFDVANLYFSLVLISSNRRAAAIYPAGKLSAIDLSSVSSVEELRGALRGALSEVLDRLLLANLSDLSNLLVAYGYLRPRFAPDPLVRRVVGFVRDAMLVRACLSVEQRPSAGVHLMTMSISEFEELCSSRELSALVQALRGISPMYSEFGEILSDLFSVRKSLELFDLGVALHAVNYSSDLISSLEHVSLRTYLLFLAETFLVRMALSLVDSKLLTDRFREVVSRWWIS